MTTWIDLGQLFGYPNCCIQNFIERWGFIRCDSPIPECLEGQSLEIDGVPTGYIMCNDCMKHPVKAVIAGINARRHKNLKPFPDERLHEVPSTVTQATPRPLR
jgi:hypothetical protein